MKTALVMTLIQCAVLSSSLFSPSDIQFYHQKNGRFGFDDLQACLQICVSVVRVKSIPFVYTPSPK